MTKGKQQAVLQFIYSNRNRCDMWIASALCTEPGVPNGNQFGVPFDLSLSEARSVLALLKEKGLMTAAGDIFGEPCYNIHQVKDTEWEELIASTREIGWIERNWRPILKTIGVVALFSSSIIYTTVLQKVTEHKIDDLRKAAPKASPSGNLHESQTNNVQNKQTK